MGRHWIGLEADPDYAALATKRIAETPSPKDYEMAATPGKRDEPKVPFASLLEAGLIQVGEVLHDPRRRHAARVRADGQIISAEHRGSIHSVGAAVQGAASCNGWTFWNVEREGLLCPIDVLRQQIRAAMHNGDVQFASAKIPKSRGAKNSLPKTKKRAEKPLINSKVANQADNVTYLQLV